MPLEYDDIPGSWGVYSVTWPRLVFDRETEAKRAFVACSREHVVPYGCYVLCGLELRTETTEQRDALRKHLAKSPYKTAQEVLDALDRPKAPVIDACDDVDATG